jgi:type II secretory pathway predicted ATPase ExeA
MYESYWQLDCRPFEPCAEARFHYPCPAQHSALLKLQYVVEQRRGAALLAGESGVGKTWLIGRLLASLDEAYAPRVHLSYPQLACEQLVGWLADQLAGGLDPSATLAQHVRRIEQALRRHAEAGQHPVIVLDEAHLLRDRQTLEAIRLLMNFDAQGQPLATWLLVGQTSLVPMVQRLPALEERLAVTCLLRRLTAEETAQYVLHRLSAAGCQRPIFDPAALKTVFALTGGIPRRINRLCDLALVVGYGEELPLLKPEHLEAIHAELSGAAWPAAPPSPETQPAGAV